MQPSDFTQDKYGRVVRTPQGYWAYVPNPLPPDIQMDMELARQLSEADRALGELSGVGRTLPNPHLLIRPFVHREAVLSSRIEGTQASLSDLVRFEASQLPLFGAWETPTPDPRRVREVSNYVKAFEYARDKLTELPVSLRLIRGIHETLMEGVRGQDKTPGRFRHGQNYVNPVVAPLSEATYVPPPPGEMQEALDAFEKYLHARSDLPPLIRAGLMHYQFEAIHPFWDGNGRVGRLLIVFLLQAEGLLSQPLLYLSAFFEPTREEYYRGLREITQHGRWKQWILYFLRGVASQADDAVRRASRLLELRERHRTDLHQARASALLLQLVDELFALPVATNRLVCSKLSITARAAQLHIEKLVRANVVHEITGQARNRVYVAEEILSVVQESEPEPDTV